MSGPGGTDPFEGVEAVGAPDEAAPDHTDPADLAERVESEPPIEERSYTEAFGLPMLLFAFALVAVVKGLIDGNEGFTIVGAVVAGGIFLAIGFSMTVAKRE